MRGKGIGNALKKLAERITPACAGKRYCLRKSDAMVRDHPRVCGEKTKESLKK